MRKIILAALVLLSAALVLLSAALVHGAEFRRAATMEDVHHASFRVTVNGSRGTATLIGQDERGAILLTNYHVVANARDAIVEGWGQYDRKALKGYVDWRAYNKNEPYDFAEIVVDPDALKAVYDPPYVALAGEDCDVDDAKIVSAGAPRGDHVTAWKGIELGKYNGQTVMFTPPPVPGQSGSLIIARIDDELWGVAILTWRFGTESDANATGGAIPIKLYYKARGVQTAIPTSEPQGKPIPDNAIEVATKARLRVYTTPTQCEPCARLASTLDEIVKEGIPVEIIDAMGAHKEIAEKDGITAVPTIFAVNDQNKVVRVLTGEDLQENARQQILDAWQYASLVTPTVTAPVVKPEPTIETSPIPDMNVYSTASSNGIIEQSRDRWRNRITKPETPREEPPNAAPETTTRPRVIQPLADLETSITNAVRKVARRALVAVFFCVVVGVLVADSFKRGALWLFAFAGKALRRLLKKTLDALDEKI